LEIQQIKKPTPPSAHSAQYMVDYKINLSKKNKKKHLCSSRKRAPESPGHHGLVLLCTVSKIGINF
jgi:hypothetical protein